MSRPWTEREMLALARAWVEQDAASRELPLAPGDANEALYRTFLRLARLTPAHRGLKGVLNKRYCMRSLFECIHEFNKEQEACGEPSWFELPLSRRQQVRATWSPSRAKGEMSLEVYNELLSISTPTPTAMATARSAQKAPISTGRSSWEQWEYPELMILAQATAETRRAFPGDGFDEASAACLLAKYNQYGGSGRRTKSAVTRQASDLIEAYRFISAFNKHARKEGDEGWFHRSADERLASERSFSGSSRILRRMDKNMFVVMKSARSLSRRKRVKREATEIHQVTERRRYRVSSGQSVVSVNEKRRIRSGRIINTSGTSTMATRSEAPSDSPPRDVARMLQHQTQEQSHEGIGEAGQDADVIITEIRPAPQPTCAVVPAVHDNRSDYTSALEHAVTAMSTQLAEIDRRLTETRINQSKNMMLRVLRACRESSGAVPTALVQEMLKRAGSNMMQAVDLANRQQEQDDELMQRLMGTLTNGSADST